MSAIWHLVDFGSLDCRVRDCQILLLSGKAKGCFLPAPYLDSYGESDQGLRSVFGPLCVCVHVCVCGWGCVHVCVCVSVCVYVCVCESVCVREHVCVMMWGLMSSDAHHSCVYMCVWVRACVHVCVCVIP